MRERVLQVFAKGGPLSLLLKGFEKRDQQEQMSLDVLEAFTNNLVGLIEAGTGTGKSFAYLIPAIIFAEATGERIVISTNTIALQQQLIEKDIPLALKVLGSEIKVVLAKGMGNYLCMRKLQDSVGTVSVFDEREHQELSAIENWGRTTRCGTRAELPFFPLNVVWEKVSAEADACSSVKCPEYGSCFFFKARRDANDAKIIICNHHLLFADLAARAESGNFSGTAVLPSYQRLIFDEAHHIEDVASDYFADKISRLEILKVVSQLVVDKADGVHGKLGFLKKKLHSIQAQDPAAAGLISRIDNDIPAERRATTAFVSDFFDLFFTFISLFPAKQNEEVIGVGEKKLRIRKAERLHAYWKETITPRADRLSKSLKGLAALIQNLEVDLERIKTNNFQDESKSVRVDLMAAASRLDLFGGRLERFMMEDTEDKKVHWVEIASKGSTVDVRLLAAERDISKLLFENIFERLSSTILCSATLSTQKSFQYVKQRVGLLGAAQEAFRTTLEKIYDSPFDFQKQVLLGIPVDMPLPDHPKFLEALKAAVFELVKASRGNAFVLFTSYSMLKACYEALSADLQAQGFHVLKQGDDQRNVLLKRFKEQDGSVLFGTDSFWEGVDVVGDALRCVIIAKLPFQVPTEPIAEARTEAITARGGNPFMEYSTPKAIVKFKQAFGRLIRHKEDRGCVICLDARLLKKSYGQLFLKSLPECMQVFAPLAEVAEKMKSFYRNKK